MCTKDNRMDIWQTSCYLFTFISGASAAGPNLFYIRTYARVTTIMCSLNTVERHLLYRPLKYSFFCFFYLSWTRKLCLVAPPNNSEGSSWTLSVSRSWHATCQLAGPVCVFMIADKRETREVKDLQGNLLTEKKMLFSISVIYSMGGHIQHQKLFLVFLPSILMLQNRCEKKVLSQTGTEVRTGLFPRK